MRICFFNRCYWPDAEATGQLLTQLCESLARRWDVTAVVGQPNFAIDEADENTPAPAGSVAARGARKQSVAQMRNGVRIERLPHLQLPKHRRLGRLANLISFTNQVRRWGRSVQCEADVLVCETDPFFMPLVVRRIARRSNAKLVFYLQDIYPDVAVALGVVRDGRVARTIRNRLRAAYREADAIVVLDEDMRDRLVDWGLDASNIEIVPNWVDCSLIRPMKTANAFRREQGIDAKFVVMHSGNMGLTQRLDVLIRAMGDPRTDSDEILLALVGGGAKRRSLEALASGLSNVRFWDYQPQDRLAESLSAADLHVISMDERITGCIAPSKLYGILGSGTPILAIVPPDSAVWRFVREHSLGWTAEPGDCDAIATAIAEAARCDRETMRRMGETGRRLAETEYERVHC
ncbi:MAG: glycosyltransferase family 4 protein, partial [Candidatus Paceibacterota bacterium]